MSYDTNEIEQFLTDGAPPADVHHTVAPVAADVLDDCPPVDTNTPTGVVIERFLARPELSSLPVIDRSSGRPVGLINHAVFMSSLAKPFYKEVYLHKNCSVFVDRFPVIVD